MRRSGSLALIVVVFALVASACGGADDGGAIDLGHRTLPPADSGGTVAASLGEWNVSAEPSTVTAGTIAFEVTNDGTMPHEFVIVETGLAPDSLPLDGGAADEGGDGVTLIARIDAFEAGDSASLSSSLSAGSYVLICNLPGHYQQGMATGFTVS